MTERNNLLLANRLDLSSCSPYAGYGSQHLALKYLGVEVERHRICEWAVKSIQAYKDLHCAEDNTDYAACMPIDKVIDYLAEKGISANYNEPMTKEQIKRMGEQKCREVFNNIIATHNLVNIMQAKGEDLAITDTDKYTYIMTYSFPCQDLSNAGKGAGMEKGSGTRSGLLWEVERLLDELFMMGGATITSTSSSDGKCTRSNRTKEHKALCKVA